VSIHCVQAFGFCDGDMIVSNADNRAVLFVCPVNPGKLLAASGTASKPGVAELSQPWSRNASEVFVRGEVWEDVVMTECERRDDCCQTPVAQDCHVKRLPPLSSGNLLGHGLAIEREQ
jgi:hypothetical protein